MMDFEKITPNFYGCADGTYSWVICKRFPDIESYEASYKRLLSEETANIFISEDTTISSLDMVKMAFIGTPKPPYQFPSVEAAIHACEEMQKKLKLKVAN